MEDPSHNLVPIFVCYKSYKQSIPHQSLSFFLYFEVDNTTKKKKTPTTQSPLS